MQALIQMTQDEAVGAVLEAMIADPQACLLCGGPPAYASVLAPAERFTTLMGGSPGSSSVFAYTLCLACGELPDANASVEARMDAAYAAESERN